MRMADGSFFKVVIIPVGIGIHSIFRACPTGTVRIRSYARELFRIRILHKALHLFDERIRNRVFYSIVIISFVQIIGKFNGIHHLGHINRRTESYSTTVRYTCFFLFTTFGSDDNHTIGGTCTINGSSRSIFQYTNGFDVGRIHVLQTLLHSVYQYIRLASIDRTDTTNIEFNFGTGLTTYTISNRIRREV